MARVLFQAQGAEWYSVKMKPEGPVFTGVLPRPKKNLKSFRYYIEVTDKALATNHTVQYVIAVVANHGACKGTVAGRAPRIGLGPAPGAARGDGATRGLRIVWCGDRCGSRNSVTAGRGFYACRRCRACDPRGRPDRCRWCDGSADLSGQDGCDGHPGYDRCERAAEHPKHSRSRTKR